MVRYAAGLLVVVLWFSVGAVCAKPTDERKMQKKAHEIGLMGQMEQANELLSGKPDLPKTGDAWSGSALMLGVIWGAIGSGYFIYGKKQGRAMFLLCGIGLCVFPMIVSDLTVGTALGVLLTFIPFKVDF